MRVLVTGASGFVGRHLLPALERRQHEVVAWGGLEPQADRGRAIDLRDAEAVRAEDLRGIDGVIHLAGLASVGASFDQPARYISENAEMEINVFAALLAQELRPRVLVVSTGGVYSGESLGPLTEVSPTHPVNPYVISKLGQELIGQYYGRRGFDVITARPFNHAGPGQRAGFLVADLALQIAEAERRGGGEVLVGDLRPRRDYTDVRDVVTAYVDLIERGAPAATYNICRGESHSGQEIADLLTSFATAPVTLVTDPARVRPVEVMNVVGANDRLRQDTGWSATVPLQRTLRDVMDDARTRMPG
jgi:GDP-4-dehydro-6-deoxy-D-mannose reductase